jgi:putative peptidoglycan lipid II flippase
MSAYTIGYVAINQAALLVTLVLAAQIRGAVTARELAFVLFQLPHGLLAVSISIVLGTTLTELAVVGNVTSFGQNLIQGLRAILFVVLPAAAGYLAIAPEIVRFLFERGVVGPQSTGLISFLLRGYAVGLVFFSSWHLIYQAFQGLGDTRTPMLINLGAFAVHAALSITLFGLFGDPRLKVMGLSLAHALSYVIASAAGFRILQRRVGALEARPLTVTIVKAGAAAVAAGTAAWLIARGSEIALDLSSFSAQAFQILGATLGGLLLYAALAKILRLEELGWLRNIIVGRAL